MRRTDKRTASARRRTARRARRALLRTRHTPQSARAPLQVQRRCIDIIASYYRCRRLAHGRGPMSGFASLIQYLTQLSGKNAPLVFEFSRHALQSEPHAALAVSIYF